MKETQEYSTNPTFKENLFNVETFENKVDESQIKSREEIAFSEVILICNLLY